MPYEPAVAAPKERSWARAQSRWRVLRLAAPVHPIFVHFTIALTVTAFGFDLLMFASGIRVLASVGWWILAAAVPISLGTVATGVKSRLELPLEEGEARSFLRVHMALGPMVLGLIVLLSVWRALLWQAGSGVTAAYLVVMFLVLLAITVQGYLGGELVYRHGAAVKSRYRELPGHEPPLGARGKRRGAHRSVGDP